MHLHSQSLRDNLNKVASQLPYLPKALALVWQAARHWTLLWCCLLLIQGLLPIATVYLTRTVVNQLVNANALTDDPTAYSSTLLAVLAMAIVLILSEILTSVTAWVRVSQAERVQDHISGLLHRQATQLDMAHYEQANYYDMLHRARVDASHKPVALLENLGALIQNGLTFVAMASILFAFGWWVPALLFLSALPPLIMVFRYTIRENRWRLRTTTDQRRSYYYNWLLTERDMAAEVRLFGLSNYFQTAFQSIRQRLRHERTQLAREQAYTELAAGAMALVTLGCIMAWMVWRVVQGALSLGDLALFYQAINQAQRLIRTLMQSTRQIYSNILFLENLFAFLALRPTIIDPARPRQLPHHFAQGVTFEAVTFQYPNTERYALRDFDLTIPAGQIVAIVGENGAGKSTLIKLLCRFYDPTAGRVTLEGIDLRELAQSELRQRIAVLFQQPVHYHATARQNIGFGQIQTDHSLEEVEIAAQAAGADQPLERLPDGYETMLGKWFSGAELSGGEWQRVALARAFLREADLIVLDEPTSAMDSWNEADWMDRFRTLVQGRTTLMITHRFTTAMHADVIHVMVDGQIVESGNHQQLLAQNGRYAASWHRQYQLS